MLEGGTTIQRIAEVAHLGVPHRPARPQAAEPDQRSCRGERHHPVRRNFNQRSSMSNVRKSDPQESTPGI